MKAIFIKPKWNYPYSPNDSTYNRIWPPLSLLYCASLLKKHGVSSRIEDAHAQRARESLTVKRALGYDKIFVTSSCLDRWQCPPLDVSPVISICQKLKKQGKEVYVMGYHGSVNPRAMLDLTGADAVIRGEPELGTLDICRGFELEQVLGAAYYDNRGCFKETESRPLADLSLLPPVDYGLINIRRYFYEILGENFAIFEGSRGCSYSCSFCDKTMYGHGKRAKAAEKLFFEIERAVKEAKVRNGYIMDLDFADNSRFVQEFCARLIKSRLRFKWCCQTRIDNVDYDILSIMKKAGCRLIHYGIETGSEEVMKAMNKRLLSADIYKNMELTKKIGIKSACFFIAGFKAGPDSGFAGLLKLAKKLNPDYASFHMYTDYKRLFGANTFSLDIDKESLLERRKALLSFYLRPKPVLSWLSYVNIRLVFRQIVIFLKALVFKG